MYKIFIIFLFTVLLSCTNNKAKTVLVCGDHVCVNKKEAQQYFEENLTLEVKIIDRSKKKEFDLIELNLKKNPNKKINIFKKDKTSKKIKTLTNIEIDEIKKKIKIKDKKKKIVKKDMNKENNQKLQNPKKHNLQKSAKKSSKIKIDEENDKLVDICKILDKCNIDEISKFLIDQGKNKDFPDITLRE